ncbi:hypothetical protein WDW37_21210 [Bdellovibrionota bacterium FG-1]
MLRLGFPHFNLALLGLLLVSLAPIFGHAADVTPPMIEVGAGIEADPYDPVEVALRVNVEGMGLRHVAGIPALVFARLRGDLAVATDANGRRITYADVEFVPAVFRTGEGVSAREIRVLPTHVGTDIHLNQDLVIRVDAIGVGTRYLGPSHISERALIYAKVAADALGYRMATHLSDHAHFYGVNLVALNAELGLVIATGPFKVRITFGGAADLNLGGNVGQSFAIESDIKAYNEVSFDVAKFFRIFIRNSLNAAFHSSPFGTSEADPQGDNGTEYDYQFMAGATFIF